MALPTYQQFLQGVQLDDIRALAFLARARAPIESNIPEEADSYKAQLTRLFEYDLVNLPSERFDRRSDGSIWRQFEAQVTPMGMNYLAQLAMERKMLSSDLIPDVPVPGPAPAPAPTPPPPIAPPA